MIGYLERIIVCVLRGEDKRGWDRYCCLGVTGASCLSSEVSVVLATQGGSLGLSFFEGFLGKGTSPWLGLGGKRRPGWTWKGDAESEQPGARDAGGFF